MDSSEVAKIRAHIKERLQIMESSCNSKAHTNPMNTKGKSLPLVWVMVALVVVVVIATLRGW